jgi:hypothetical protein
VSVTGAHVQIHVYQLQHDGPSQEELEDEGGDLAAANHWLLPAKQFHGLWDSLVFDADIKTGVGRKKLVYETIISSSVRHVP